MDQEAFYVLPDHSCDRAAVYIGDCLDVMNSIGDDCVDLILTDPPYGLSDHSPEEVRACMTAWLSGKEYRPRAKGGYAGRAWDAWVPGPEVWRECKRILKPGGHVMAFAATRSMDLMALAIRLAGFEFRDTIGYASDGTGAPIAAWIYGSGMPHSLDVSAAIDAHLGSERPRDRMPSATTSLEYHRPWMENPDHRLRSKEPITGLAKHYQGWGTGLKPAWEPMVLARKPLEGTVAENVVKWGTGALNIGASRVEREEGGQGRYPTNVVHDGSALVAASMPKGAKLFYVAKPDKQERAGSLHPTVKPLALMRYLARLGCPPDGVVIDPFAGSGSTVEAALLEGMHAVGIEQDASNLSDIINRLRRAGLVAPVQPLSKELGPELP